MRSSRPSGWPPCRHAPQIRRGPADTWVRRGGREPQRCRQRREAAVTCAERLLNQRMPPEDPETRRGACLQSSTVVCSAHRAGLRASSHAHAAGRLWSCCRAADWAGAQAVIQVIKRHSLTASVNAFLTRPSLERCSSESLGYAPSIPDAGHSRQRSAEGFPGFTGGLPWPGPYRSLGCARRLALQAAAHATAGICGWHQTLRAENASCTAAGPPPAWAQVLGRSRAVSRGRSSAGSDALRCCRCSLQHPPHVQPGHPRLPGRPAAPAAVAAAAVPPRAGQPCRLPCGRPVVAAT